MSLKSLPIALFFLFTLFFLLSCSPSPIQPPQFSLYIYRFNPPAFIELSDNLQPIREIPFSVPPSCSLLDVFPALVGKYLLIELNCPNGQTVLFLDSDSGTVTQPVKDTDSHFLAWANDGLSAYLKVDSLGNAHVTRMKTNGKDELVPVTAFTYDLSTNPVTRDFIFSFSRGLGQGSELWLAKRGGKVVRQLYADRYNYISYARYSPDGQQIAFIKIPDSQTPFTVGELWVISADGSNPRKLADADAGHGYAEAWSPDSQSIAYVKRENPLDQSADQAEESLISNIELIRVQSGETKQLTSFPKGRVETPHWSPDGNTLVFTTVLDGRMEVQSAEITSGEIRSLIAEPACCPAWLRK